LKRTHWILLAAVALVAVGALWTWRARTAHQAPRFRSAEVERGSISSTVSATGTVQPVDQVEVGSQVSGTVYRLNADYNSRVADGQILCELEPSAFQAREAMNEASVARAEAALEDGKRQLRRAHELSVQNLVSQADLEAVEVAVLQRQADLKAARAQLDAVRVDLRNTIIRAPISGVVISRNIDLGQTVAASLQAPKLFVIAKDLGQMQVETRIDEADIGVVRAGLPVTFTVDAFPDNQFRGEVSVVRLEPIMEQGVVTYTTVIRTENPDLKLRPGMTANVTVLVARHDDVLRIPAAALRFRPPVTGRNGHRGGERGASAAGGPAAGATERVARAGPMRADSAGASVGEGARRGDAAAQRGGGAPAESGAQARMAAGRGGVGEGAARGEMVRGPGGGMARGGMTRGRSGMSEGAPGWMRGGVDMRRMRAGETAGGPPREGGAGAGAGGMFVAGSSDEGTVAKPGAVYVLRNGKPIRVEIETGLTDGTSVEIVGGDLKVGDQVLTGVEVAASAGASLQPPPGMGGAMFGRGPGGGGGGGGGGRR
jgi:HlyD family secretion protein